MEIATGCHYHRKSSFLAFHFRGCTNKERQKSHEIAVVTSFIFILECFKYWLHLRKNFIFVYVFPAYLLLLNMHAPSCWKVD